MDGRSLRVADAVKRRRIRLSTWCCGARLGENAKATKVAEPQVRDWLAVLARCFQLLDGISVLELDCVQDASPEELDRHRLGLDAAREKRVDLISHATSRLLTRMGGTVRMANAKVLFNPFDAPAAVASSRNVAECVLDFRARLEIESSHEAAEAKRWGQAAVEARDKVLAAGSSGAAAARRRGDEAFEHATGAFRSVDIDGDGVPDRPRAAAAAEEVGAALKGAASGVAGAFGTLFQRKQKSAVTDEHRTDGDADGDSVSA